MLGSPHTEQVYIGSCVATLNWRLSNHIAQKDRSNISSKLIVAAGDVFITSLERVVFTDIKELREREKYHIQNTPNCVNIRNRYKTLHERQAAYRERNRERIRNRDNQRRHRERELNPLSPQLTEEQLKANKKAYTDAHKDEKREYDMQYRASRPNDKIQCECGGSYMSNHKSTHFKTKKHQAFDEREE